MYTYVFWSCVCVLAALLAVGRSGEGFKAENDAQRAKGGTLRWKYLAVFLLFKLADWMQGPYFHEMYSTKASQAEVAILFLTAFVAGTFSSFIVGKALDTYGAKPGCITFAVVFAASGLTALSDDYNVLLLGRALGGLAASLLYTAPESWLINEINLQHLPGTFTDHIFSWIYFSDGLVAILAGWVAEGAVAHTGTVTAPFTTSSCVVLVGGAICAVLWGSARVTKGHDNTSASDEKAPMVPLLLLALMQALYESSMYVFVLNWGKAVSASDDGQVPFGTIFSAFMTCTMIGTTVASLLMKSGFTSAQVLTLSAVTAVVGLGSALVNLSNPLMLTCSFCLYEASVGMYFPSIGPLRAQLIPESSRGLLMNLNRVPLNLLVIAAMLYYETLGVEGCLRLCITSLTVMLIATFGLPRGQRTKSE